MENEFKLREVRTRKDELIAQQLELTKQINAAEAEEAELGRIGRLEGLRQIGVMIMDYKIPKHEVVALYSELNLTFKSGRPTAYKKREETQVNNPVLEGRENHQEIANQFTKLFESGMHTELMAEATKCVQLEEVLILMPAAIEEYILENLS